MPSCLSVSQAAADESQTVGGRSALFCLLYCTVAVLCCFVLLNAIQGFKAGASRNLKKEKKKVQLANSGCHLRGSCMLAQPCGEKWRNRTSLGDRKVLFPAKTSRNSETKWDQESTLADAHRRWSGAIMQANRRRLARSDPAHSQ